MRRIIFSLLLIGFGYNLTIAQIGNRFIANELFIKIDPAMDSTEITAHFQRISRELDAFGDIKITRVFKRSDIELAVYFHLSHTSGNTEELFDYLNLINFIHWVEFVPLYSNFLTPNDLHSNQWSLRKINAPIAWDAAKGDSTIVVAITDDAIYTDHEDLSGILWRNHGETGSNSVDDDGNGYIDDLWGWDAYHSDPDPNPPASARASGQLYHGTHVAGIAGAHTDNSRGMASIGNGISIMSIKCASDTAPYNLSSIALLRGIEYAIVNKADVINMSWGGGAPSKTFQAIFQNAHDSGIVLVAAAGNDNDSYYLYPASYQYVISVGATDSLDRKSSFSQYNDSVDVMAPGTGIYSCLNANSSSYGFLSGTSMASPMVAGLCGLILSRNPDLTPDEVEFILKKTCKNIDSINGAYSGNLGAGRINADSALTEVRGFIPAFAYSPVRICPGNFITYTNQSRGIYDSIRWHLVGASDTIAYSDTVTVRYDSIGSFDASLTVYAGSDSAVHSVSNAINVAMPTAKISGNRTIIAGNVTFLKVEFTGNAPYSVWYTDGLVVDSLVNILTGAVSIPIQPLKTASYNLIGFNDAQCSGNYSGEAKITVNRSSFKECSIRLTAQDAMVWTSDDTSIHPAFQLRNFGADSNLILQATNPSGYNHISRVFIEFNLPSLPAGTEITKATMRLYNDSTSARFSGKHSTNGNNAFEIMLIEEDWFENSVTYNTQPKVSSSNIITVSAPTDANQHFDSIDVTGMVQNSINSPQETFGFGLKLASEFASKYIVLASSEHSDASLHPVIELCYRSPIENVDDECMAVTIMEKYSDLSGSWSPGFDTLDKFGSALANIGDIDKDGVPDLMVGSPTSDDGGTDKGSVFTIRLKNDGTMKSWVKLSSTSNLSGITLSALDSFGYAISTIGDLNKDLIPDVIVGAPGTDDSGTNTGAIYVLFMKSTGVVDSYQKISATAGNFSGHLDSFDRFGASVTHLGDLNNDGLQAIAVGAPGDDDEHLDAGAVWILFLDTNGMVAGQNKLSGSNQELKNMLDSSDGFGSAVLGVDLSRDGRKEIVVGAPGDDDGLVNSGAIYTIDLTPSASIISVQKISTNEGELHTLLQTNSRFGSSLGTIQFDHNAIPDLLVGMPGSGNDTSLGSGGFYLLTMRPSGVVMARSLVNQSNGVLKSVLYNGDQFGMSIAGLGDINGDGISEFAVGAASDDDGGKDQGAIYVISMKDSCNNPFKGCKKIEVAQKISDISGNFSATLTNGVQFGTSLDFIGDLDGDSIGDYVVGTPYDNTGGSRSGAIFILFMNANHSVKSYQKISHNTGGLTATIASDDWFGWDVASIGDVNGDTIQDIAVGAFGDGSGTNQKGAVYILHLNRNGTVKSHFKIRDGITGFSPGMGSLDQFGISVESIGDIDGDSIPELAVGAQKTNDGGSETGAVYILFMGSGSSVKGYQRISNSYGNLGYTLRPGTRFGRSVTRAYDQNEDGIPDIMVSMHGDTVGGSVIGKAGILLLDSSGKVKAIKTIVPGRNGFNYTMNSSAPGFSLSLGTIPDETGNGKPEFLIGAPSESVGGSSGAGAVFAVFPDSLNKVKTYFDFNKDKIPFEGILANNDGLAFGLAGHVNSDTTILAFGVPFDDDGGTNRGAFYIVRIYDSCVSPPPICELKPDFLNNAFCLNNVVEFVDISSDPSHLDITFRKWDMGDGTTYLGDSILRHKYDSSGLYTARLIVSSEYKGQACLDSIEYQIEIRDTLIYKLKKQDTICYADSLRLNLEMEDCFADPMRFKWTTIGGINNDTLQNPVISARENTWYYVKIRTGSGYLVTDSVYVVVDSTCCRSLANFTMDTSAICLTGSVNISNLTSPFGTATYDWNFGLDATPSVHDSFSPPPITYSSYGYKTIRLIVNDQCGSDTLSKQLFVMPVPVLNNYIDSSYCYGDTAWLNLSPYVNSEHYFKWEPDSQVFRLGDSLGLTVNNDEQVILKKYSRYTGCYGIDTINIGLRELPTPELGTDTSICSYDSIWLKPNEAGDSFLWNTGSSDSAIWVHSPGTYMITVINNQCIGMDSITIDTIAPPRFDLGLDTGICPGDSVWIGVINKPTQSYQWNGLSYDSSWYITGDTGRFILTILEDGCIFSDSINISRHIAPHVDLGNDTFFCEPGHLVLKPTYENVDSFAWVDGSVSDSLWVDATGVYSVKVFSAYCEFRDTVQIQMEDTPVVDLGPDIVDCQTNAPIWIGIPDSVSYSYLWSNGDTLSGTTLDTSSLMSLTVWNGKCHGKGWIRVDIDDSVIVDLGKDTAFCSPGNYIIRPVSISHSNILWSDGSSNDSLVVNRMGDYVITVQNGTCVASDTIHVREVSTPFFDLGPEQQVCQTSVPIEVGVDSMPGYQYRWSTGDTFNKIKVSTTSNLTLIVMNEFCMDSDTLSIVVDDSVLVDLGPDTSFCEKDQVMITPLVAGPGDLQWSTGEQSDSLLVVSPGVYWLMVTNGQCISKDTIIIREIRIPEIDLGNDTFLCNSDSFIVTPTINFADSLIWLDNGSHNPTRTVRIGGMYRLVAYNEYCSSEDSLIVEHDRTPEFTLGPDTTLCLDDPDAFILYDFNHINGLFWWHDSLVNRSRIVKNGLVSLSISNRCGVSSDTVLLETEICSCYVYIPNAFTPNLDGLNDRFKPIFNCEITDIHFSIYNRLGVVVYYSDNVTEGWDGTYKGGLALDGLYCVEIFYKDGTGKKTEYFGVLELLRQP